MKTLILTAKDFKKSDSYYKLYCGKEDVSNYEGNIEIEENLGWVKFNGYVSAKGSIYAGAGTGIMAVEGIRADESIRVGWGIETDGNIGAGWGIEVGMYIQAGGSITAAEGITAGLSISCKLSLKFAYRLFAGTATWNDATDENKDIICGKLEGGKVCYGTVKELGLPNKNDDKKKELLDKAQELIDKAQELIDKANELKVHNRVYESTSR